MAASFGLDIAVRHPERLTKLWAFGANTIVTGMKDNVDEALQDGNVVAEDASFTRETPPEGGGGHHKNPVRLTSELTKHGAARM